jgi:hypothetical protein
VPKTHDRLQKGMAGQRDMLSPSLQSRRTAHKTTRTKEDVDKLRTALAQGVSKFWNANPAAHERLRKFLRDDEFKPAKLSPAGKHPVPWEQLPWIHLRAMLRLLEGMTQADVFGTGTDKGKLQYFRDVLQWACTHSLNGAAPKNT